MRFFAPAVLAAIHTTDAHLLGKLKNSLKLTEDPPASPVPKEEKKKEKKIKLRAKEVHPDTKIWLNGVQQVGEGTTIKDQAVVDYCVNFSDQGKQDLSGDSRVAANFVGDDFNANRDASNDPTAHYDKRRFKVCGGGNKVVISLRVDCQEYTNGQVTLGHCDSTIGPDDPEFCQEYDSASVLKSKDQPLLKQWQSWKVMDCDA